MEGTKVPFYALGKVSFKYIHCLDCTFNLSSSCNNKGVFDDNTGHFIERSLFFEGCNNEFHTFLVDDSGSMRRVMYPPENELTYETLAKQIVEILFSLNLPENILTNVKFLKFSMTPPHSLLLTYILILTLMNRR